MLLRSLSLLLLISILFVSSSSEENEEGIKNGHSRNHYHHRGKHGRFHSHQPQFLKEVSKGAKKEYYKIIFARNSTRGEIKKNLVEWSKKNGVEKQLAAHNEKRELFFSEHNKNVTEAIPKLAAAQTSVLSILKDESLTRKQSWEKINELTKNYSPQLKALVWAMKPHRGGYRGMKGEEKKAGKKEENEEVKNNEKKKDDEKESEEKSEEDI